jgi:hypothetical protein
MITFASSSLTYRLPQRASVDEDDEGVIVLISLCSVDTLEEFEEFIRNMLWIVM